MPMPIQLRLNFLSGFVLDMLPGWDKIMAFSPGEVALFSSSLRTGGGYASLLNNALPTGQTGVQYEIYETFTRRSSTRGGRVSDIASEGGDPYDVLLDIAIADELRTSFGFPPLADAPADWAARGRVLHDPRVVVGASDAGAHLDMIDTFRYTTDLSRKPCAHTGSSRPRKQSA